MCSAPSVDRRRHVRVPLSAALTFRHAPTDREFPARGVDVSQGGLLMYAPATAPLQAGHRLRISIGQRDKPSAAPFAGRTVNGTVVRVDRHAFIEMGHVSVGVAFDAE